MADYSRFFPRPLYRRDTRWEPFCEESLPSCIYKPDLGLPPFLEPGDLSWIQWAQRRLATSSWPGYMPPPLFTPIPPYPSLGAEQPRGVSEIRTGPESWRINLDVSCFSPREVTIRTREGYLEISGNHEDRQDEYGLVSKCFSRKYNRLPAGADLRHIRSALSGGVLSVEAPLPAMAQEIPVEIIIPVQVEKRPPESREEIKGETVPPVVSQENSEVPQAGTVLPAGSQEKSSGPCENKRLLEKQTEVAERECSSARVEPEEDMLMEGEDKGEGDSREETAMREAMLATQANLDSIEGQDLYQTAPAGPAPESQNSALDNLQVEGKKQLEARWMHLDTKWMGRSTKWPSQQY
ncbi:hypothetical protein SKAU_G00279830 [Synaphobranchus kaupii]|uniref:SHSP domain-containing protein n=1 Tax=Synaphobranchus kaupii TaxID=118154 RepID=A0A9Q1ILQ9_SYNKA|nr:hypothetical protein SKAU_G00279830 [Synaphobranchus kaupii]